MVSPSSTRRTGAGSTASSSRRLPRLRAEHRGLERDGAASHPRRVVDEARVLRDDPSVSGSPSASPSISAVPPCACTPITFFEIVPLWNDAPAAATARPTPLLPVTVQPSTVASASSPRRRPMPKFPSASKPGVLHRRAGHRERGPAEHHEDSGSRVVRKRGARDGRLAPVLHGQPTTSEAVEHPSASRGRLTRRFPLCP